MRLASKRHYKPPEVVLDMGQAKNISGSEIIARALKNEGLDTIFLLIGDHILPVADTLGDSDFRLIDTRHEQAAVHMAEAWGRLTGGPSVAMYTTPGFANAIPGLASAWHSESPVLSISGSAELSELGRGAMQEIDQVNMARPITKGSWMVTDPRRIPDMIARALRLAMSGRRGPVHLTIPVDLQEREVPEDEVRFFSPQEYRGIGAVQAEPAEVREALDLLHSAKRPLIIAGSAAAYNGSGKALQKLAEVTHLPVMTEGDARGLIPDDHEYSYGFYDHGLNRAARKLREADVVMLLGRKQDVTISYALPPTVSADAQVIQVDPDADEIGLNRGVRVGIAGDVDAVVSQMADEAARLTWSDLPWLKELEAEREAQAEEFESLAVPDSPMHALFVHKTLKEMLRPDDFLAFDGGDFCHYGRAVLEAQTAHGWMYFSPLGMLGGALPTAIAAQLANPERRSVAIVGDGAFGFNAMELDTAVRHKVPIVVVLGNDAAWGIDYQIQLGLYGRPTAAELLPTRYDQVASGLGAHAEHVSRPEDLRGALERAFAAERPALVNIDIQRAISPRAAAAVARWKARGKVPF